MKISVIPISRLVRPERNVRHHPQKQIEELKRSLAMFGQTRPLIVDEGNVVLAGNGTLTAMEALGWTEAECYVYAGLTEARKKKLMLADNRVYDLGLTDMDAFDAILKELDGDIDIPGWDEDLLRTLTASLADVDAMIGSYGSYAPEAVETIQHREAPAGWVSFADDGPPGPVQAPPVPPYGEQAGNAGEGAQAVATGENGPQAGAFILCPHCGARIPLGGDA